MTPVSVTTRFLRKLAGFTDNPPRDTHVIPVSLWRYTLLKTIFWSVQRDHEPSRKPERAQGAVVGSALSVRVALGNPSA